MADPAFDFESASDIQEDDFQDAPDIAPQPEASFDFDNAITVGNLTETAFFDKQNSVVELPAGGFQRIKAITSGAYARGDAGREMGELYFQQLIGNDTPEVQGAINSLREKANVEFGGLGTVEDIVRAGIEQTPQLMGLLERGTRRGLQGALAGGAIGVAGGPASPVTVPGGALAGGGVGVTFGIAEHSFIQNAGESYGYMSELLDKEGVQLEAKNLARMGAVLSGAVNAGLDTVSFGMLSKVLLGKNLALDALRETGAKSIVIPKTKEAIGKFIVELGKAIAVEAVTEGVQEGVKSYSGEIVKHLSDQEFDSLTGEQIFKAMGDASAEAAKATLAIGGAGGGIKGGYALGKKSAGGKDDTAVPVEIMTEEDAIKQGMSEQAQVEGEPLKITIPNIKDAYQKPVVEFDNPGGEWLENKQKWAEEDYAKGQKVSGPVTGYTRVVDFPVSEAIKINGANNETPVKGTPKFDNLMESVERDGFNDDSPILIGINHRGEPYILEGNNRAAVANAVGKDTIKAEIKYYAGGETKDGALTPKKLEELVSGKKEGATQNTPESQIEWLDKSATRFDEMAADAEKAGDTEAANNAKTLAAGRRKQSAEIAEKLQIESAKRANEAITPIMEQEKKAQQEKIANIQSETDDISMNLLREVTALQEDKSIVDPELHGMLENTRALLQEQRETTKPIGLTAFIKSKGGISDISRESRKDMFGEQSSSVYGAGGELQNMGMKNRAKDGARNDKTGIGLDTARELAVEAGYIDADATIADFLVALENDFKYPNSVIAEMDMGTQSRLDEIDNTLAKLDEALDRGGYGTYSRERLGDLRRRVAENKKLDKATAREMKKREGELHRLAADKKLAEQSPPKILADKMTTFLQGLRKGTYLGRYEALDVQNQIIDMIEQSGLEAEDRAKFIRTIKNTQTIEQLQNKLPEIIERVERLADTARRRSLVSKIKSSLETARKSNIIAVDFVNRIEDMVNEIDTQGRTDKTINSLQKTLDYLQRNPDADMPKRVLNKLEILNKKPLEDVTTEELQDIANGIDDLIKKGKLKFELLQNKKERLKQKRIELLQKSSVPINEIGMANRNIGERLTLMDGAKNKFREYQNKAKRVGVATNPMDVFFDMMDGGKKYLGENYRIFKKTIDESFSRYLDLRESATRDVKNLADKLDLNDLNFEKIGAWAVLQQEGGEKKLLDSGVTQEEIDRLQLDDKELQMYQLMREKLDEQLPAIQKVMREVYNMDVEAVSDYFPFMTDHDAMSGVEIQDQFGPNTPSIAKKKNVEKGMTISRTLGSQKVRIDAMGVFLRHMDNATYLIEMGKDIKDLGDVAQSKEYKEAAGDLGQQMVVEWINLLARKGNLPGRIAIVDTLRRNVGAAMLGFKLSTVMIQVTALADGASLVGGNYVAQGSYNIGTSREWRQFILNNFPEVRERVGDDQAYLDGGPEGIVKNIREAGYWALKEIDALVASSVAAGAYIRAVESRGGEVDFSKPDADAITEAQMMMRRTQSSPFAKDSPALFTQGRMSGNVSLDKAILQFQSFMFNRWSLIKHDMWELGIKQGDMARAMNVATWLIIANIAEMGLRRGAEEIVSAITGDDEDRDEDEITQKAILTTLNNVPFVSQAVSTFEYGGVPVPSVGMLYRIGNELRWVAQSEDEDKRMQHALSAIGLIAGTTYGLPGTIQAESIMRKSLKDE